MGMRAERGTKFTTRPHPETLDGVVFLTNAWKQDIHQIGWKSKRAGSVARDVSGAPIDKTQLYPVFVSRDELERAGFVIEMLEYEKAPAHTAGN